MEGLIGAQKKWERLDGLEKTIEDVQQIIDLISRSKEDIAHGGLDPAMTLVKLKNPIKDSFERLNKDAKDLHAAITNYGKQLDKRFKPLHMADTTLDDTHLVNRAIGMHLLREGVFDVASTFVEEVNKQAGHDTATEDDFWRLSGYDQAHSDDPYAYSTPMDDVDDIGMDVEDENDYAYTEPDGSSLHQAPRDLERQFASMYAILHSLRNDHDLDPAITWASEHSEALEARGSNLEFELCRLRFIELYTSHPTGPLSALSYARQTFPRLSQRHLSETASLLGALAYTPSVSSSPYASLFAAASSREAAATSFQREFCGLLGLSEASPLYTAVAAGGIALPVLEKLERVMGEVGGQWTSQNELPVEIPLPPQYLFHSIFVCPVSKEQATDANPAVMMPCGHVICKESLDRISKGLKFKCPYCPGESQPRDAKKVFF